MITMPFPQGLPEWRSVVVCLDIPWLSGQVFRNIGTSFSSFAHLARPSRVPCGEVVLFVSCDRLRPNSFPEGTALDIVS
jgi:hypothetical protein